jgi:glycosyltransferase involved in cell wall biosynthesis
MKKLNNSSFTLKTISDHPDTNVEWDLNTVASEILAGDIAVIPAFIDDWGKAKSNNRLTMFMALGMPVIASANVPVYKKIVKNGYNGFLADTIDDWTKHLLLLKDLKTRATIGLQARSDVLNEYSIDVIGKKWIALFEQMIKK